MIEGLHLSTVATGLSLRYQSHYSAEVPVTAENALLHKHTTVKAFEQFCLQTTLASDTLCMHIRQEPWPCLRSRNQRSLLYGQKPGSGSFRQLPHLLFQDSEVRFALTVQLKIHCAEGTQEN